MSGLDRALALFYAGDTPGLATLLRAEPALVHARVASDQGHYCGYFYRATLLHHVAGNPTIAPLPAAAVELATVILDAGAEVDAATEPGPSQPTDIGWTTLGLAASSLGARQAGVQRPLLELLRARGADLDARNGGALMGALYYGELDAARWLVEQGARVDLVAAAGLGRVDLMAGFVGADGALGPDAHTLAHYSLVPARPTSPAEVLALALAYAAMRGHADAVTWLLDHGADLDGRPPFDHRATALHWAAFRGHAVVVDVLLARGADRTVRDTSFDGTAQAWAAHEGHAALAARLAPLTSPGATTTGA